MERDPLKLSNASFIKRNIIVDMLSLWEEKSRCHYLPLIKERPILKLLRTSSQQGSDRGDVDNK